MIKFNIIYYKLLNKYFYIENWKLHHNSSITQLIKEFITTKPTHPSGEEIVLRLIMTHNNPFFAVIECSNAG